MVELAKYISGLHRCDMGSVKECDTSMVVGKGLTKQDGIALKDASVYRSLVGGLLYCTLTGPKISFSVNKLCQFMACLTDVH